MAAFFFFVRCEKYELEVVDSNFIVSIYGKEKFYKQVDKAISEDKILYYDKEKSQVMLSVLGHSLSEGLSNLDHNKVIHQSRNIVKQKKCEVGETLPDGSSIISKDKLLFCEKMKSQALFERWGEQYSELTNNLDYNKIIHQSRNIVNQ